MVKSGGEKMKLSACVITKNEAKNITKWLASMKKIAHEMIVVDTGSTDDTVSIAKAYGAKVFEIKWENDFSKAKNYAIDKACGDWILFLDADERFTDDCIKTVPIHIAKYHKLKYIDAIVCRIFNIDEDVKGKIINTFGNIRIFRNATYLRYKGNVHEMLYNKHKSIGLCMLDKILSIYHTGYSTHIVQDKLKRNLALLKEDIAKNGEHPSQYRYLCDCYHGLGDFEKTIEYARKFLESGEITVGGNHEIHKRLIDGLVFSKKPKEEIMQEIEKAIQTYPIEPTFWYSKGDLQFQNGRFIEAEQSLHKALELDEIKLGDYSADMFILYRELTYLSLGKILLTKGDKEEAMNALFTGLQINKYNQEIFSTFYEAIREVDEVTIIEFLNTIYQLDCSDDIKFLVENLQKINSGRVKLYYMNIARKKNINCEINEVQQLIDTNKYDIAEKILLEDIHNRYIEMMVATIGLRNDDSIQITKVVLPDEYVNVLEFILYKNGKLTAHENEIYFDVLRVAKVLDMKLT